MYFYQKEGMTSLSVIIMGTAFSVSPIKAASKGGYSVKVGKKVTIDTSRENAI